MRAILILNPKGGCGKSTIAMNLAGYFAQKDKRVAIADYDPLSSIGDWLAIRPETAAEIRHARIKSGKIDVPGKTEILIIDTPAALHGKKLVNYVKLSQTIIMPLLPSPLDIRATERFIEELFLLRKLIDRKIKLTTVANRVRADTLAAVHLEDYLGKLKLPGGQRLPFMAMLRNSQNYIRAAEKGLSIFEFAPARTEDDRERWKPLTRWLNSSHSRP